MSRVTCQRCRCKSKAGEDAYALGWAYPAMGGIMCPECYDQLTVLRALLRETQVWAAVAGPFDDDAERMWQRIDAALGAK